METASKLPQTGFHFYSAKIVALVVAALGLAILLWQLLSL
jgi:hypothetical protein